MSATKIQTYKPIQREPSDPKTTLRDAAKQYEQYFLNEMVKAMRGTIDAEKNENSFARDYYTQQLDQNYVTNWSDRGGVGLADLIYNQIAERFFPEAKPEHPRGPVPIREGTTIKIDETRPMGIPVVSPSGTVSEEVSFLYEWESLNENSRPVELPWQGEVQQVYRVGDNRQVIKVQHDNGLVSTLSFIGESHARQGDVMAAGQNLGRLSPDSTGLTWQVAKVEPFRNV